jgi:hypothetical protein
MNRAEWAIQLAEAIRPSAAKAAATQIGQLLRLLADLPDAAFTEASVRLVAERKPGHALNLAWLRGVLNDYLRARDPMPVTPTPRSQSEREASEWEDRKAWLRRDWDDPAGILRRVHDCQGNVLMLRLLGKLVRHWAPQHLGFLPPHILEAIETDSEIAPRDQHLRYGGDTAPDGTRSVAEQLAALRSAGPPVTPRHLDPSMLDRLNPLPNGRKRVDAEPAASPAAPPVGAGYWPASNDDPEPGDGPAAA